MIAPIVWVDVETGGLNLAKHQLTQIAAIPTTGTPPFEPLGPGFEAKILLQEGHYNQEALDLSSYDEGTWEREAIEEEAAVRALDQFAKGYTHEKISGRTGRPYACAHVAGQNVVFDGDFIRAAADRAKVWLHLALWNGGMLDTVQLAKWYAVTILGEEPPNYRLETLYSWLGLGEFEAHDALEDVRATIRIAREIHRRIREGA